mmetsp:Transcript_6561/g.16306  ORF Transcript_6561/g.16306 Transcript_6561/m.16306 type:complete len:237 (+) Transcript_6561:2826-3536(+)
MEDSTATSLMPSSTEVSRGNIPGRARARRKWTYSIIHSSLFSYFTTSCVRIFLPSRPRYTFPPFGHSHPCLPLFIRTQPNMHACYPPLLSSTHSLFPFCLITAMSAVDRLRLHPSSAKADSVAKRRPTSAQQRSSFQHRGRRLHTTNTGAGTPRSHLISPKYVGMLMLISTFHFPRHYPIQPRLAVCLLKLCSRIHPSSVLPLPMMCQSPPSPALSMSPLPFLSPHEELNVLTHLR